MVVIISCVALVGSLSRMKTNENYPPSSTSKKEIPTNVTTLSRSRFSGGKAGIPDESGGRLGPAVPTIELSPR
jgi:hypothetical protein